MENSFLPIVPVATMVVVMSLFSWAGHRASIRDAERETELRRVDMHVDLHPHHRPAGSSWSTRHAR